MAPKRRTSARTPAPRQQATLSFHGKNSKITKQPSPRSAKSTKKDPALDEDIVLSDAKAEVDPDLDEPTTAEKAIAQQAEAEADTLQEDPLRSTSSASTIEDVLGGRAPKSDLGATGGKTGSGWVGDEEAEARKISDTQIKRYWRQKESERLAPRIHQENLSLHEKILREWDMSGQFGPCIGIARLKRWKRANVLGLNPPVEVLAVLLKEMADGATKSQRAHVDELMSSRYIET